MKEYEWETEYGVLKYNVLDNEVMVTEYKGKDISLIIPDILADMPVTIIGKKAFLGAKSLRSLILSESLMQIQEWAFASCSNLETIFLPCRKITVGLGIFKDCNSLQKIIPTKNEEVGVAPENAAVSECVPRLLAAAVTVLDAFYLFDLSAAGNAEWFKQWDARMMSLIEQEDMEGFSKMLLCGEEDYGSKENNLDYYVEQRKRFKVRLAMLRLMYDVRLDTEIRAKLISYLQLHKKGGESEETWKVVLEEHGDEKEYYQFLLDFDCIDRDNFEAVLSDMGEKHTEMKSFLMNCCERWVDMDNVFAGLEL
ncbi:MAG: leucine-rich repeat domain-containing protein [Clostridiales bacterium]|nr:leucine-rich repeat domain-containing protein [Clostridiales bacterium]